MFATINKYSIGAKNHVREGGCGCVVASVCATRIHSSQHCMCNYRSRKHALEDNLKSS